MENDLFKLIEQEMLDPSFKDISLNTNDEKKQYQIKQLLKSLKNKKAIKKNVVHVNLLSLLHYI